MNHELFELIPMSTDRITGLRFRLVNISRLDGEDETAREYVGIIRDVL